MFSPYLESGVEPDPEVRREAQEEAARMVAAREEEREQIEKERLESLRELLGDYEVDDLVAGTGEPSGKRGRKKGARTGMGRPAFPQVGAGEEGVGESDGEFFRRSKRLMNRAAERATKHGVAKGSAKTPKVMRAAVAARVAAELSREAFGEGSHSWAEEMDTDTEISNPTDGGADPSTVDHSVIGGTAGGMAETPKISVEGDGASGKREGDVVLVGGVVQRDGSVATIDSFGKSSVAARH
jgi:hypothetical protein